MKKQTIIIAIIAAVIMYLISGCNTVQPVTPSTNYQLMPIGDGLFRFNKESGKTEFLIQSSRGMVWIPIIAVPERTTIPIDINRDAKSN